MGFHREYLAYPSQVFMVTFNGEADKPTAAKQRWRAVIESATRGKPRHVESREADAKLNGIQNFVKESLDSEFGNGRWKPFTLATNPDGTLAGCGFGILAAVDQLFDECGVELAREQLENDREPEIVALCGGLENALKALAHRARLRGQDGA